MPKTNSRTKKPQYFDYDRFISGVITDMKLGDVPAPVLLELREAIEQRLSDRITATIINAFTDREMKLFENMLVDHPELDDIDALIITATNMEGLTGKLERQINSLYAELVYDAFETEKALRAKAAADPGTNNVKAAAETKNAQATAEAVSGQQ